MRRKLLIIFTILGATAVQSQIHELGVTVGATNYIGDIGSTKYINPTDMAYGFQYRWNKSPRHSWRVNYTYMPISAKDSDSDMPLRLTRDLTMKNNLNEIMLGIEFNFFEFDLHNRWFAFTPNVHTGISGLSYKETYFNQYNKQIEKDTEYSLAIPVTLGIKALINKKLVISAEVGARYALTDNLDGNNPANLFYNHYRFWKHQQQRLVVFSGINISYTFGKNPCYCAPR